LIKLLGIGYYGADLDLRHEILEVHQGRQWRNKIEHHQKQKSEQRRLARRMLRSAALPRTGDFCLHVLKHLPA